jgi:CHAT domain-containing protein
MRDSRSTTPANCEEARRAEEAAEEAAARHSDRFRREQAREHGGLPEAARALPADAHLLSFARYTHVSPRAGALPADSVESYCAFVLAAGDSTPEVVRLGPAATVDSLAVRWAESVRPRVRRASGAGGPTEVAYRRVARALKARVWDPLRAHLPAEGLVLVVQDGSLALVNLAALPAGDDRYLAESGPLLHLLSSERDVLPRPEAPPTRGLLAIGGPAFDARIAEAGDRVLARETAGGPAGSPTFRGQHSTCARFRDMRFPALPASRVEAEQIGELWRRGASSPASSRPRPTADGDVVSLTGTEATETAFRSLAPGRRALHLATHAFVLGEECVSATGGPVAAGATIQSGLGPVAGENPLVRSGLVFSGVDHRGETGGSADDGVLTAEEIGSLNLAGTEWAVLSACNTGGGTPREGEGMLGLRRAFEISGVRTLITSLWPVDDAATLDWMRRFYRERLERGASTAEALRNSQREVLRVRRSRGLDTHPSHWAAFVASGDWR